MYELVVTKIWGTSVYMASMAVLWAGSPDGSLLWLFVDALAYRGQMLSHQPQQRCENQVQFTL